MTQKLAIFGAGGHAKVCLDVCAAGGSMHPVVVLDDDSRLWGGPFRGLKVAGGRQKIGSLAQEYGAEAFFIAIADNRVREELFRLCLQALPTATLVHPSAQVGSGVRIGRGSLLMPSVVVNADAEIGEACILNTACSVDHDCVLGHSVHIGPGARLAGGVRVGSGSLVGTGAVVAVGRSLGRNVTVGAGAAVIEDLEDGVTAVGVPARALQSKVRSRA